MVRSSSFKTGSFFLRKHRRWPHSPFKTKWHQIFNEQLALRHFKQTAISPQSSQTPHLLSSLINSFQIYNCQPTPQAYHFLLRILTKNSLLLQIPLVLDHLQNSENFETPISIFSHLIQIYGRANQIHNAVGVFYKIPMFRCVPSVSLLNTLLSVLCSTSEGLKLVPQVLLKSPEMNIRLEESTFLQLIDVLCRINKVGYAVEIFRFMLSDGYCINSRTCSLILKSICEQVDASNDSNSADVMGFVGELRRLGFCPGMVDYSNIIKILVKIGKGNDAFNVLNQMKSDGIKPDIVCYTMVLNGLIENRLYSKADKVFDEMLVYGLVPDVYAYNVYIKGLCKQSNIESGIKMIACMEELGCKPNLMTYNIILNALFKSGETSKGWDFVRDIRSKGLELGIHAYKIMIDDLISTGKIIEAYALFVEISGKDLCPKSSTYDGVICGLCRIGAMDKALELLEKMLSKNMIPSVKAWGALLAGSRCSKKAFSEDIFIGLVDGKVNSTVLLQPCAVDHYLVTCENGSKAV